MAVSLPSAIDFLPRRVACLQPSATVTLRDLGLLERVVACTRYCAELCPELRSGETEERKRPLSRSGIADPAIVSDSWSAQSRQIIASRPDLVIASVPYQLEAVAEILKAGIRFLGFAPHTLAEALADILATARVMGAEQRGAEVVGAMQQEVEAARSRAAAARKPRVFCEEWGKPLIASQPWVRELVEAAGGEFVGTPGAQTSFSSVLEENPDIVIAAWCGAGERVPLEKLARTRGWSGMRAFQQGRVYCLRDEFLNTPASTLLAGLRALAWAIHPELSARPKGIRRLGEASAKRSRPNLEAVV